MIPLVNDHVLAMYMTIDVLSMFFNETYHIDGQIIKFLPMGMYEVSQPAVLFCRISEIYCAHGMDIFGK